MVNLQIEFEQKKVRVLLLLGMSLLIMLVGFMLDIRIQYNKFALIKTNAKALEVKFAVMQEAAAKFNKQQATIKHLEKKNKVSRQQLQKKMQVAKLLHEISLAAKKYQLKLNAIKPEQEVLEGKGRFYPIELILSGKYVSFISFVRAIKILSYFVVFANIHISSKEGNLKIKTLLHVYNFGKQA